MNSICLLNSSYNIENINGLLLRCSTSIDSLFITCQFSPMFKGEFHELINNDSSNPSFIHLFDKPKEMTEEAVINAVSWVFKLVDSIYCCIHCEKYFFDESYKGTSNIFQCNSCIANKLYLSSRKSHKNILKCDLCLELNLKKNIKNNSNCCFKSSENLKYICKKCFDKLEIKEPEDNENFDLFVRCPWCRGMLEIID